MIPWETQTTLPRERTRLTNASIPRTQVLATYENVAAWMAIAEMHRQAAAEAERMALAALRWTLEHPESDSSSLSIHELRRWMARRAAPESEHCAR